MHKVIIPFGPQHPALKEPESFLITLKGATSVVSGNFTKNCAHRSEFITSIAAADFQPHLLARVVLTSPDPAGKNLNPTIDLNSYYFQ